MNIDIKDKNAIDIKPTHIGCTPKQIEILSKTKAWKGIDLKNDMISWCIPRDCPSRGLAIHAWALC